MNFQIHIYSKTYNETQKHNASTWVERCIDTKNWSSTSIWSNANHQPSANQLELETICNANLSYANMITLESE